MATVQTQGTTIGFGNGDGPPETFDTIGEVRSISGPDGQAPEIDVTTLGSTAREFNMGLPDEGTITLTCHYDPADTEQTNLRTARSGQTLNNFQIECADTSSTTLTFAAYVLRFSHAFEIDNVAMLEITLRITGGVTYA